MGHTEMGLAVAGLSPVEVSATTRRLAGDWSDYSAAERAAFHFARKQAENPSSVTNADVRELEKLFGTEKAWSVIWWSSRCHYMTKVADAFQLPLERENPFWAQPGARKK